MAPSQAQDDHGYVYSFLGLAPFFLRCMTVTYVLSTEEAFPMMAKALIKETRTLDFLDALPVAHVRKPMLNLLP